MNKDTLFAFLENRLDFMKWINESGLFLENANLESGKEIIIDS